MAIKKKKFFEIIQKVSEIKGLTKDNLLEKIKNELRKEDEGEYGKFCLGMDKNHQFSIKISEETAEDWSLLHLAAECNNLLTVKLLLEKKVSVNARVKDGSSDGPTALHIAALHGYQDMVKLLVNDDRVNPSLKSKNTTPKEMVGDMPNRDAIIEILEEAEQKGEGTYHSLQNCHGTSAKTVEKRNSVTAALENGNTQTSLNSTDESSDSTVNKQRQSVREMIKNFEPQQRGNATCSSKQTPTDRSDSKDSGLELEPVEENVLRLKQQIQDLESKNATLNNELDKTKTKTNEVSLEKTGKRQMSFLEVASVNLVTILAVSATLSIAFDLSVLSIIAISVAFALIASGVTYAISKPTTELKEVNIQGSAQHGVCKA